jgi:hypothetical protein
MNTETANMNDSSIVSELLKNIKPFKLRCSGIGQVMGVKGLGKTGETFLNNWIVEQIYNRRKDFYSKYTEKGTRMEEKSIEYLSQQLNLPCYKNEEFFEDDDLQGTPDIILDEQDLIIDNKCSWDCFTFPFYAKEIPSKDYEYQLQGYMALTGKKKAMLAYTLMDADSELIKAEAKKLSWEEGYRGLVEKELYDRVKSDMTYSNLPDHLRIKTFEIERNESIISSIRERVKVCKEYIKSITE